MKQKVFLIRAGKIQITLAKPFFYQKYLIPVVAFYAGPVMSGIKCRGSG
jgi:hypothetical protein